MQPTRPLLALSFVALFALGAWQSTGDERVLLGPDGHRYEWVKGWGKLPAGMSFGNTHGCIVVDSSDRVYMNTDTENAVIVFSREGEFQKSWGKELAGGLHGMCIVKEGDAEFLYLTHTGRHEALKATLDGEILWTLPWPEQSGVYANAGEYAPTSIAVAPDGTIFVADGYGKSWIHVWSRERKYLRSFGGPGSEIGKLATPHGIQIDARGEQPVLLVSDRENHRLQSFDLEGRALGPVGSELRRPCHTHQAGGETIVADLAGRISLFDAKNELIAHLGDNPDPQKRAQNGVPREQWKDGEFLSPHCARFDAQGSIYVLDWNALGRITKLRRVR
ncbi:MAG: hypothetical protein IT454_23070 [Planctomycetes bacterium]|nr:hypothetical protein [Planctomycetota bacterium]